MAAPRFAPVPPAVEIRGYESPDHVPDAWVADRPGEIEGRQPRGGRLGYQGPDQGYALLLAERRRADVRVQPGESVDDALRGSLNIALRRASKLGRAPVMHDLTIALTIWGWLDPSPPPELVAARRVRFEGMRNPAHHYLESRALADSVPSATLAMTPEAVTAAYPQRWRELTGA